MMRRARHLARHSYHQGYPYDIIGALVITIYAASESFITDLSLILPALISSVLCFRCIYTRLPCVWFSRLVII